MGGQCSGVLNADTPQGLLNCIYFAKVTYIQLHWPPLLQQKGLCHPITSKPSATVWTRRRGLTEDLQRCLPFFMLVTEVCITNGHRAYSNPL